MASFRAIRSISLIRSIGTRAFYFSRNSFRFCSISTAIGTFGGGGSKVVHILKFQIYRSIFILHMEKMRAMDKCN